MSGRHDALPGTWGPTLEDFVSYKRSVGHEYGASQVYACARLCRFIDGREMDEETFAEWAAEREGEACTTRGKRVQLWNDVARFVNRSGGQASVVEVRVPYDTGFTPHVFTDDEVARILRSADAGIAQRASAYEPDKIMPVLIRLFYSTGMRYCEAARLRWDAVDGQRVSIAGSKNGKPRLVMMSESMAEVMEGYRALGVGDGGLVFCGRDGGMLQNQTVNHWHHAILDAAEVRTESGGYPRLHDYRHGFALRVLAAMDAAGTDIYVALPLLSRYMGHCGPQETELYLRLTESGRARILGVMESYAPGIAPKLKGLQHG